MLALKNFREDFGMSCPKCGSRVIRITPAGGYVCTSCGYSWPIPMAELGWAYRIFLVEKLYEQFKDVKPLDCAKLKEELTKRGASAQEASRIARRIARRNMRLTNDKREKDVIERALENC